MRNLVAALACRNNSTRLYGKPLQLLDIKKKISVIQHIINQLKKKKIFKEIVLGISKEIDSKIYVQLANKNNINYIFGDEFDVLSRLIKCGDKTFATDIFRITTESPFPFLKNLKKKWKSHIKNNFDASFFDPGIDGCGYEIIKLEALKISHQYGKKRHRSELCSSYVRENINKFKINFLKVPNFLKNNNLRLTIDYPEDLIICRYFYNLINNKKKNNFSSAINEIKKDKLIDLLLKNIKYKKKFI